MGKYDYDLNRATHLSQKQVGYMKKFKVKNRPKRKYVKKSDLAQSYSSTQSLTVGLVPLVLMAIAFFTTVFMTSSYTANLNLPAIRISLPEIPKVQLPQMLMPKTYFPEIKMNAPELPKIATAEMPTVTFPRITIPNPFPVIENGLNSFITAVGTSMHITSTNIRAVIDYLSLSTILLLTSVREGIVSTAEHIFIASVSFVTAIGRACSFFLQTIVTGILHLSTSTVSAIQHAYSSTISAFRAFGLMVQEVSIQFLQTIVTVSNAALNATINGFNAFMWFLGTPFRALHAYSIEIGNILAPYGQFLAAALKHASDDLNQGGENLVNGTVYVSTTVENNSK